MDLIWKAAAEVPTGIPTGIPPVVTDAASKVMADSPAGALLILTAVALIVALYLLVIRQPGQHRAAMEKKDEAHDEDRDDWQKLLQGEHDKRIEELRNVTMGLANATAAMSVFSQTQADRTATLQEIANKLDRVSITATSNSAMLDRNLQQFQDRIADLSGLVRNLIGGPQTPNNGGR
ncbi:hypothetical protein [Methylobacterium sp. WL7]|uniref:hypothetical protein n=1 Tax=Methylobacterium sp. WL7 TaxID=2603900 RepID=UPI0011C9E9A0|nr:hypothetical protein [Methylobacterium sp. WL7]TXN43575.1 hypothetical protein FV233_17920 [Methylobacterium sp. WL7]